MKSIEEKAKAYDEALKVLHKYDGINIMFTQNLKEEMFPKLAESEDERIINGLIRAISKKSDSVLSEGLNYKDVIAWLEKQEQTFTKKDVDDAYLKGVTDTKNEIEKQYESNYQIRKDIATFIFNYRGDIKDRAKWMDYLGIKASFVEKQEEQKPAEWEPQTGDTFRKKGTTSPTYHLCDKREDGITFGFVENREVGISGGEITIFALRQDYELVERPKSIEDVVEEELNKGLQTKVEQKPADVEVDSNKDGLIAETIRYKKEQKPADKVEPKFREGEWIVHHGTENIYQVVAVIDNQYQLKYGDNYTIQYCADVDRCARLWDITKDAKDGDVLCSESGWTCIFKALDNHTNTFSSYCFMDSDKWFCNTGSECHTLDKAFIKAYNGEIYPATKEQCDLLFQKMEEAGYEWDAEKLELKKIEQKPWSEEDDQYLLVCKNALAKYQVSDKWDATIISRWLEDKLKSLKDRVQPQPKQEWSEKDEEIISQIEMSIAHDNLLHSCTLREIHSWLKSLRPQNKQEWLGATKEQIYTIAEYLDDVGQIAMAEILYGIHLHNHWKPSEEQMNSLKQAIKDE